MEEKHLSRVVSPLNTLIRCGSRGHRDQRSSKIYRLQYKGSLNGANWTDLDHPVTATAPNTSAIDNTGAHTRRFYRVLLLN